MWNNGNGDYLGDLCRNDPACPWGVDYRGPYKYRTNSCKYGFTQFASYDMGAVSFGLLAPDGTGIDYFAFAGETASKKVGSVILQYGSPYDGMYTDNKSTSEGDVNWTYIAHDSFMGTLTSSPVTVEEAPAAFAVAQNSPNPFNPTTTISFTIAEAANVTVEVYNVAGQKVDTVASEFMNAGSHSVTWDASAFSAGVYFYTVKAGEFSRTMKMTLLR